MSQDASTVRRQSGDGLFSSNTRVHWVTSVPVCGDHDRLGGKSYGVARTEPTATSAARLMNMALRAKPNA